jgi:hypothetical protein
MRQAHDLDVDAAFGARQVEHICLESEEPPVVVRRGALRTGPTFRFVSKLRGLETELAFSADHCLAVLRSRSGKPARKYFVDLRFVDAEAIAELRVAWRWWLATAALAGLSTLGFWLASQFGTARWHQVGLQASIVFATASACVALLGLYRTRMTIELRSVHGGARLAEVAGSLGSTRDARTFIAELSRRVEAARGRNAQPKQQFLRDEMREHHRLWREGVLSDTAYEASKRRILAAHG